MSSAEAELRALKEATMEAIWFRLLLEELGFPQTEPTLIRENNSAVITLVETLKAQPRTRHLNKIRHFISQEVTTGSISVIKVLGTENVADLLTKALELELLSKHRITLLGPTLTDY